MIRPAKKNNTGKDKCQKTAGNDGDCSFMGMALKGLGVGLGITCIAFVICALILTYTDVSESYIGIVSTVCTAVSSLAVGLIWARGVGRRGLATGALAGAVYCIIMLAISIVAGGGPLSAGTITCLIVSAAGGGIGGVLGVNAK